MRANIFYSGGFRWRKIVGLFTALLFVVFLLSGIALNHSRALHLDQVYVADAMVVPVPDGYLMGAIIYEDIIVVASADDLFISTYGGEVVERASDVLEDNEKILRLGMSRENGDVVIESNLGRFRCDPELYGCLPTKETPIWSNADDVPLVVHNAVLKFYYGDGLSFADFLVALHTGRFNPFFVDVLLAVLLCFSVFGVYVWTRQK